jgi:L-iditol 2-dehydrogenase
VLALRYLGDRRVELLDVPTADPKPGEVKLRPEVVGLCGTDPHIIAGDFPASVPVTLGHEVAGRVEAVGRDVTSVREGDLVAVEPHLYCDSCRFCRLGRPHLCVDKKGFGVRLDGGCAEQMVVPATCAYPVGAGVAAALASFAEPVACCVHGIDRLAPAAGLTALVFGGGAIGCIMVRLASLSGLTAVVVEPVEKRRKLAADFGAAATFDPGAEGWEADALKLVPGGYDYIIDAVGSPLLLERGIELATRGGTLLVFGVAPPGATAGVSPRALYDKELTITASAINPFTQSRAIELLPALGLERLTKASFPLFRYREAFTMQASGAVGKVQILPQAGHGSP